MVEAKAKLKQLEGERTEQHGENNEIQMQKHISESANDHLIEFQLIEIVFYQLIEIVVIT